MAVQKYKPKCTPRELERKVESNASQSAKVVDSAKSAIAHSRKIMETSRKTVTRINLSKRA